MRFAIRSVQLSAKLGYREAPDAVQQFSNEGEVLQHTAMLLPNAHRSQNSSARPIRRTTKPFGGSAPSVFSATLPRFVSRLVLDNVDVNSAIPCHGHLAYARS